MPARPAIFGSTASAEPRSGRQLIRDPLHHPIRDPHELELRVREVRERTPGKTHPQTCGTAFELSLLFEKLDRLAEARRFARQAAEGARQSLPEAGSDRVEYEKHLATLEAKRVKDGSGGKTP